MNPEPSLCTDTKMQSICQVVNCIKDVLFSIIKPGIGQGNNSEQCVNIFYYLLLSGDCKYL